MAILDISVVQYLPIAQGDIVQDSSIPFVVNQSLSVAHSVHCSVQFEKTNQVFNVHQAVTVGKNLHLTMQNVLNITQVMGPTYAIEAQNVVHLIQKAANVNPQQLYQSIHVTQSAIPLRAFKSVLSVSQTIKVISTYNPNQNTVLILTQSVVYFKTDAVTTYNITTPVPIAYTPIILTYNSKSLTLKIPEIGDSDKIDVKRVQEQTRGGDLIIFRDPIWSKTETLKYKLVSLTRLKAQALLGFFTDTIGLSIQLTDHQGVVWDGIITTPQAEITCTNDNNCGSYEVEFEFQVLT